jgi:hypothetical protein
MQLRLETAAGDFLLSGPLPVSEDDGDTPDVILWGERIFARYDGTYDEVIYREAFVHRIDETEAGAAS